MHLKYHFKNNYFYAPFVCVVILNLEYILNLSAMCGCTLTLKPDVRTKSKNLSEGGLNIPSNVKQVGQFKHEV